MWYPLFLLGLAYYYVWMKKWGLFGLGPPFLLWFVFWVFWPVPTDPQSINETFDIPGPKKYGGVPPPTPGTEVDPDSSRFRYSDLNQLILDGDVPAISLTLQRDLSQIAQKSSGNATALHFAAMIAGML